MDHGDVVDQLADILVGVTPDVLEDVLNSLNESDIDFSALSRGDVIAIVSIAVSAAASAVAKQYLERNREEVRAVIGRGLTGS